MTENAVRLRIVSRLTDPDGETRTVKNARSGTLDDTQDGLRLVYDDIQEGDRSRVILTFRSDRAKMERRGFSSTVLTFLPGSATSSVYVTPYGEIPIRVCTNRLCLEENDRGGRLLLDYAVFAGGDKTSDTVLEVEWRCI